MRVYIVTVEDAGVYGVYASEADAKIARDDIASPGGMFSDDMVTVEAWEVYESPSLPRKARKARPFVESRRAVKGPFESCGDPYCSICGALYDPSDRYGD